MEDMRYMFVAQPHERFADDSGGKIELDTNSSALYEKVATYIDDCIGAINWKSQLKEYKKEITDE